MTRISILLLLFVSSLYFCHAEETFSAVPKAAEVEKALIHEFYREGEIRTRDEMIQKVGPFIDPTNITHMNYTTMIKYLKDLNEQFPTLTKLYSIGKSLQGRELWVFVVSKHAQEHHTGVPEFKYVANMHGNEVSGRVFLLSLAWTLLNNYETNAWMKKLVDTTRIHLMPTMNPDGYEVAYEGDDIGNRGRGNANGKDLNRNFPSRFPNFFPSSEIQPETMAVMTWSRQIPFVLSANLHGGTTLVNYPFDDYPTRGRDRRYSPSPDNNLFVRLAYSYARTHERMWKQGPRCISDEHNIATDPQTGIVNGADWYIVPGGMQDWMYLNTNAFELTVEINCVKFPLTKDLRWLWNENKYSLLHFIEQVHNAIHGRIIDAETGKGIVNATVSIDSKSKIVISYGDGEFWRMANLGTYEVTFDHPLYVPQTRRVTVTRHRRSPEFTVTLQRLNPLPTTTTKAPTTSFPEVLPPKPQKKPSVDEQNAASSQSFYILAFITISYFTL